jgi:hypothetical protein
MVGVCVESWVCLKYFDTAWTGLAEYQMDVLQSRDNGSEQHTFLSNALAININPCNCPMPMRAPYNTISILKQRFISLV